jgi:hypothetical protein
MLFEPGARVTPGSLAFAPQCSPDRLFVVAPEANGYIGRMTSRAHRIVLADHARLPWRFFGRLTAAVLAGL